MKWKKRKRQRQYEMEEKERQRQYEMEEKERQRQYEMEEKERQRQYEMEEKKDRDSMKWKKRKDRDGLKWKKRKDRDTADRLIYLLSRYYERKMLTGKTGMLKSGLVEVENSFRTDINGKSTPEKKTPRESPVWAMTERSVTALRTICLSSREVVH
ncbi:hypothetical protein TNCV_3412171 [Trichonephila clavipes]|nr:hypothetical protein TNCV_3412171 [Trichonephila clavipes]